MNRKKLWKIIIPIGCILLLLVTILLTSRGGEKEFSQEYIMAEELAPLLSFTYYDTEQWEEKIGEFAKGKLSYKELAMLLECLNVKEYITYEERTSFRNVSRSDFFQVYEQVKGILDVDNRVMSEDRVFIGREAKDDTWLTQIGYETITGGMEYISCFDMYRVYTMDGKIIGLEKKLDTPVIWENVFVHTAGDKKAEVLFEYELFSVEMPQLNENITDTVCDIEFINGTVSAIYKKEDRIQGKVLSYNEQQIEIEGYGGLAHNGDLKIYKTYGTVEQLNESKLLIGNLVAEFVVAKGEVCGIILKEPAQIEQIRVLLLNNGSPYYPEVYVMANEETTVTFKEGQQKLPANTLIQASACWNAGADSYLKIETATETGNIFLVNEKGEALSLGYQGHFEIRKYEEGFCVVNELSLEDYLCAVVPSEMPSSYHREALRVQAICARSYACIQLQKNQYVHLGAHVDDSTNYQVYNKQERTEATTLAVRDTVGEVICFQGAIAEAYYYSTSCGFSQDMNVWNQAGDAKYGYLHSQSLLTDGSKMDLSNEEVFTEFIKNNQCVGYDSEAGFFRWRGELDLNGNREKVNQTIANRKSLNGANVQICDSNGNPIEASPADLGSIVKVQAEERTTGGVLKSLRILYEKGSVLLITEYNIRNVLAGAITTLTDKNDNAISIPGLLPSAAFTVIPVEKGYVLYGGGYGHGIGMSQNGANGMAKAGFSYGDILRHFYHNITIENIYNVEKVS